MGKKGRASVDDFNEIGAYFCQSHGCNSFDEHYDPAAAFALYLDKESFGAVEHSAVNAYLSAFLDVDLLGAQVGDAVIAGIGDGDELLHLSVRDDDWDVFAIQWTGVVLQEINALLQGSYSLSCGVYKDEVVYGGNHPAALGAAASLDKCLFHRDKTFDAFFVEVLLCDEFAAVRSTHGEPDKAVVIVHCMCLLFWLHLLMYVYSSGSSSGV